MEFVSPSPVACGYQNSAHYSGGNPIRPDGIFFILGGVGLTAKRSHRFFYHGNGTYKYQTKQESGFAIVRIVSSSRVYQQVPKIFGWSKTSILGSANPSKIDSSTTSTPCWAFPWENAEFCPTLAPFFSSGSHFSFDLFLAKSWQF